MFAIAMRGSVGAHFMSSTIPILVSVLVLMTSMLIAFTVSIAAISMTVAMTPEVAARFVTNGFFVLRFFRLHAAKEETPQTHEDTHGFDWFRLRDHGRRRRQGRR
jgi:hypothetical protein